MPESETDEAIVSVRPTGKILQDIQTLDQYLAQFDKTDEPTEAEIERIIELSCQVANHLKDLRYRTTVGLETTIISGSIRFLTKLLEINKKRNTHCLGRFTQSMRIIGNLVHTHDINRQKCLDAGLAPFLTSLVTYFIAFDYHLCDPVNSSTQGFIILLTVAFNLALDYSPAQTALSQAGFTSKLIGLTQEGSWNVKHQSKSMYTSALLFLIKLIDLLLTDELSSTLLPEVLSNLTKLLFYHATFPQGNDFQDSLLICLIASNLISNISENADSLCLTAWIMELVITYFTGEEVFLWLQSVNFINWASLPNIPKHRPDPEEDPEMVWRLIKTNLASALVLAVSDAILSDHTREEMSGFLLASLQHNDTMSTRPDFVTLTGLWIGNLACNESACKMLVEECNILDDLADVFRIWSPLSKSNAHNVKIDQQGSVLHAWCGLARNLAVADAYKIRLGELNMLKHALSCLDHEFDKVEPLKISAVALLRHLCRNCIPNIKQLLSSAQDTNTIIDLARAVEQPFLRVESHRLLSTLINTAATFASSDETLNAAMKLLKGPLVIEAIVQFACFAKATQHLILVNEAIVSLALLSVYPDLTVLLCQNLLKVQKSNRPTPTLAQLGLRDDGNGPNALDVLLWLWIPQKGDGDSQERIVIPSEMRRNSVVILQRLGEQITKLKFHSASIRTENKENEQDIDDETQEILKVFNLMADRIKGAAKSHRGNKDDVDIKQSTDATDGQNGDNEAIDQTNDQKEAIDTMISDVLKAWDEV
ncbi:hypothetical protein O181_007610 [Austropuccinia psidii MF-1]|uniref:Uncharacterized protein n=1 Tax=Austropuccinia psidii MF-1 TaxID=1389203 RepID=A0A9Q3BNA9_9BASI|nr:hypothetical protein [Austropuccinia psidii MF-1]